MLINYPFQTSALSAVADLLDITAPAGGRLVAVEISSAATTNSKQIVRVKRISGSPSVGAGAVIDAVSCTSGYVVPVSLVARGPSTTRVTDGSQVTCLARYVNAVDGWMWRAQIDRGRHEFMPQYSDRIDFTRLILGLETAPSSNTFVGYVTIEVPTK